MKKVIIAAVAVMGIVLAGCSSKHSTNKPSDTVTIVNHAQKAAHGIKSGNVVLVNKNTQNKKTSTGKFTAKFHLDPMIVQAKLNNATGLVKNYDYFIDGRTVYIHADNSWSKQRLPKKSPLIKSVRRQVSGSAAVKAMQYLKKHLKLTKNQTTDVLSYNGHGKLGSMVAKKLILAEANNSESTKNVLKKVTITKFIYKYTLNKKTYLPTNTHIYMQYQDKSSKKSITEEVTSTYSNVNQVKKFKVPDVIKHNAPSTNQVNE
ncbi:DUF6612 family protein [Lentilactobacillus buchneri]|uniref:Uncharacterized protein n=1 Tax=Lentilactobacillus buchneri subsp. silagei CD034 TaxID=1071400 RepID=J9W934_LENBU|nr:DUF6612 family protein [Lentilactobacillus buchneri]AFS01325.1 hypothetical protein LBUCD034_2356 [Lentilactobacillus buchneri subsp. silagei CD034]